MTIGEVKAFFQDKKQTPCPLTEQLVKAGYQQVSGGYIDRAKWRGVSVNYKENSPSQYWHLMTYCDRRRAELPFTKSVVCGELIFWMAEVSGAVDPLDLKRLVSHIIESADLSKDPRPVYDRKKWNREIQRMCFEEIQFLCNHNFIRLIVQQSCYRLQR